MAWLLTGDRLGVISHSPRDFTAMWLAMTLSVLAMGPPLLLREIGILWCTSLRRMRHLMIAAVPLWDTLESGCLLASP